MENVSSVDCSKMVKNLELNGSSRNERFFKATVLRVDSQWWKASGINAVRNVIRFALLLARYILEGGKKAPS